MLESLLDFIDYLLVFNLLHQALIPYLPKDHEHQKRQTPSNRKHPTNTHRTHGGNCLPLAHWAVCWERTRQRVDTDAICSIAGHD